MQHNKPTIPELIQELDADIRLLVKEKHTKLASLLSEESFLFHASIKREYTDKIKSEVLLLLVMLSNEYAVEDYMIALECINWDDYL